MKKKDATQKSWGKTTGGTSRRGMHHDIMNHYEEVDEARKGARVILQAILDTSATMEHQPTDSVHLCDTCAFFTDSSTAWYINQHKFTFTSCFLHRKNLSLSLSLSLHNMWNRFFFGALQAVGPHLPTSGASAALAAARPLLLGRG